MAEYGDSLLRVVQRLIDFYKKNKVTISYKN
jgi:hypothetical protein